MFRKSLLYAQADDASLAGAHEVHYDAALGGIGDFVFDFCQCVGNVELRQIEGAIDLLNVVD